MRITYFVNKYPSLSHTFIRREISELEQNGCTIQRLSLRSDPDVVDPADHSEMAVTTSLLGLPRLRITRMLLAHFVFHPMCSIKGMAFTLRLARRSGIRQAKAMAYFAEAILLKRLCSEHSSQLLRVHFGTNCAVVARICKEIGGPPYSIAYHGPDEFDKPLGWDIGGTVSDSLFVTAITHYCSAQIKRWAPVDAWDKVHIVRCSVNPTFLTVPEMPCDPPRRLCAIGRFSAQKGLPILIRSFAQAVKEGADIRLDLVGDGELRAQIENTIDELGIREYVVLHGALGERGVADVIGSSCGLVMASFAEGLPVVLMEAMGLGRPVIATRITGVPELVAHGINGWLVPADDGPSLVEALHAFASTPSQTLRSMGRSAHEAVREKHNITTESSKLKKIMHRYLEH